MGSFICPSMGKGRVTRVNKLYESDELAPVLQCEHNVEPNSLFRKIMH